MPRLINLAGQRFGKLLVCNERKSQFRIDRHRIFWKCLCDCGRIAWVEPSNLRFGNSTACRTCCKIKHGHASHRAHSPTYRTWAMMLSRCRDQNSKYYYLYGGRGIKVCKRWEKFKHFLADMGEKPAGTWIERINVNGNYVKSNCCWATPKEQAINRRSTRLSFEKADVIRSDFGNGVTKAEIARKFAVSYSAIVRVLDNSRWVRP